MAPFVCRAKDTHIVRERFISSFLIRASRSSEAKIASGNEPNNRSTRSAHLGYDTRIPIIQKVITCTLTRRSLLLIFPLVSLRNRKNESVGRRKAKQLGVKNRRRRRPSTQPKVLIGYGCVRFEARVRTVEQCRSKNRQTSQSANTEIGADG